MKNKTELPSLSQILTTAVGIYLVLLLISWIPSAFAADLKPLKVGVLKFGTVNWELQAMQELDIAKQHGVDLQVVPLSSKQAVHVALQGGAADVIVTDWLWVSRQRSEDKLYTFYPYSLAVGALMVAPDSGIKALTDLPEKKLGIAGGAVDKSWLLLRAYYKQQYQQDLSQLVEPIFSAPPLLNQLMLRGEIPATLNYWHYNARLQAAGMQPLLQVDDILQGLGISNEVPLVGWVFDEQWGRDNAELINQFLRASYATKQRLREDDAVWKSLKDLMKADDQATFIALRDGYRAGTPKPLSEQHLQAAAQLFKVLAAEGGKDLVGQQQEVSAGTFWDGL